MVPPEITPEVDSTQNRILKRLDRIGKANYPPISANARWLIKSINEENTPIELIDPKKNVVLSGVVDFKVQESPIDNTPEGFLTVDSFRLHSVRDEVLDSELVRTISIAAQFPGVGYCRPLRMVYEEALMAQMQWLNAFEVSGTLLDPRVTATDTIIRSLIGGEALEHDFGLSHWNSVIDSILGSKEFMVGDDNEDRARKLRFLHGDSNSFILARLKSLFPHAANPLFKQYSRENQESDESAESNARRSAILAIGLAMRELE